MTRLIVIEMMRAKFMLLRLMVMRSMMMTFCDDCDEADGFGMMLMRLMVIAVMVMRLMVTINLCLRESDQIPVDEIGGDAVDGEDDTVDLDGVDGDDEPVFLMIVIMRLVMMSMCL